MTQKRKKWTLPVLMLTAVLAGTCAHAADLEPGSTYCFSAADFQTQDAEGLTGACIVGVPDAAVGTVSLGSRVIRPGDILTAAQLDKLTLNPGCTDGEAAVTYLPICGTRVEEEAVLTFSIRRKANKAPTAEDQTLETYKNLAREGQLTATDPEGGSLTYTIVQDPKRGTLELREDGSFTYTPKKNKVGRDSFTFTATDEAGQVSNEAVVTIEILKPLDSAAYKDLTAGQFEALWMRNTGLFAGTQVAGEPCFGPDETLTRGDFLAMVMKLFDLPREESVTTTGFADEDQAPDWLLPYLASAMRLGVVSGSGSEDGPVFRPNSPITQAEAAVMLQNVLMLPADRESAGDVPVWAESAVTALRAHGADLSDPEANLTRLQAARLLYAASTLEPQASGLEVFRKG